MQKNASVPFAKLRGRIKEVFNFQNVFAEKMGMCNSTLSEKMNRKTSWTVDEVERACSLLGIQLSDAADYFFRSGVEKTQSQNNLQ